jgi:SAM-dependent methyltransferase
MPIPSKCPLCKCGSIDQSVVTPHVYGDVTKSRAFYHCNKCDVHYQYPALSPEEEARFYSAEFEGFMAGRSGEAGGWQGAESHIRANETTMFRRMKYLTPHVKQDSSILEVGCSSGFMLLPFLKKGHSCTGVEPSGFFSDDLRKHDIDVYPSLGDLKIQNPAKKFDIIIHFFVLEHIADPLVFLENQYDLLNPGGKIIFEIPNVADALYSVYDIPAFERFYWSVAHPWYFSEQSLIYILDKMGRPYEILFDQRYDLSNHMTWARDGKPGGMGRYTEQLGKELEELYKQSLVRNRKCDTLIGVITKEII